MDLKARIHDVEYDKKGANGVLSALFNKKVKIADLNLANDARIYRMWMRIALDNNNINRYINAGFIGLAMYSSVIFKTILENTYLYPKIKKL